MPPKRGKTGPRGDAWAADAWAADAWAADAWAADAWAADNGWGSNGWASGWASGRSTKRLFSRAQRLKVWTARSAGEVEDPRL